MMPASNVKKHPGWNRGNEQRSAHDNNTTVQVGGQATVALRGLPPWASYGLAECPTCRLVFHQLQSFLQAPQVWPVSSSGRRWSDS